jgi:hypothetical protein
MAARTTAGPSSVIRGTRTLGLQHAPNVLRELLLRPVTFFAVLPRNAALTDAFVFGLAGLVLATAIAGLFMLAGVDSIQGGASVVLFVSGITAGQELVGTELTRTGLATAIMLAPIVGTLLLVVMVVTAHLLVIVVVGDDHAGFGATSRAIGYASAVNLANWLPVVGLPLNLYGAYLAMLGLRELHGTSTWRAALVAFVPAVATIAFFVILRLAPE